MVKNYGHQNFSASLKDVFRFSSFKFLRSFILSFGFFCYFGVGVYLGDDTCRVFPAVAAYKFIQKRPRTQASKIFSPEFTLHHHLLVNLLDRQSVVSPKLSVLIF